MIGDYLETYTFEYIMNKALSNVPDTLDKREGSIIYDALAPACYQLAEYYINLRKFLSDTFITTATGEYLDHKVAEQGLTRYSATKAVRKGVFTFTVANGTIPIGSRFSTIDGEYSVNFEVTGVYTENGQVQPGSYILTCEEAGSFGNDYVGELMAITNINGLTSARMDAVITSGRDVETDDELRARYLLTVKQKPFGGNIAQYDELIKSIGGVGEVQIYPVWNGGGTVKCVVVDTDYEPIEPEAIARIQQTIDPSQDGSGIGMAPIGHKVTITTPTPKTLNIKATITPSGSYTIGQLSSNIKKAIEDYLLQLRKEWGVEDNLGNYTLSVYIARISNAILTVSGVANVTNISINDSMTDLTLSQTATLQELPMLGTVTLYG